MKRLALCAVVVLAAATLSACNLDPRTATLPGGTAIGGDGYTVTAMFTGADNLVPNSEVQYQNVRIGTVRSITLDQQHVACHGDDERAQERGPARRRRGSDRPEEPARRGVRADHHADPVAQPAGSSRTTR